MSKIKSFLDNPVYFITSPASKGYFDWMSDSTYLKLLYRVIFGRKCNMKKPLTYNEKMQWLKINDRKDEYASMVDKYEVRAYIEKLFGSNVLIPCYGVFTSWEEIDFDVLPDKFVIKCTHDSGSVEICTNKASWDKNGAELRIKAALKRDYYKTYREWPYKNVKHRIIVEKYMIDDVQKDLRDYKIMCFNGKARIIEVHENRFTGTEAHTQTFYSEKWEKLDISQDGLEAVENITEKPILLDKMISMSETISAGMYHARIDWYIANGQIYFGEITFYDGSGFERFTTEAMDRFLGDLIDLGI